MAIGSPIRHPGLITCDHRARGGRPRIVKVTLKPEPAARLSPPQTSARTLPRPEGRTMAHAQPESLTDAKLRWWLMLLRQPDRMAQPDVEALLRAHGRLPDNGSAI